MIARRLEGSFLEPRGSDLLEVVRAVGGVQAQVQASAELQLAARVDGLVQADVRRALWEERSLAKAWTIRGTLHLHVSDELGLWLALRRADPEPLPEWRGPRGESLPALALDEVRAGREAVWAALDGRVLTREELADAVGPPAGDRIRAGFGWFLDGLCQGPPQGARITLARPDQWVPKWSGWSYEEALREAARRYAEAFAPVRPAHVQEWLGLPAPVPEVPLRCPAPTRAVRLVPEYDAYVMGFRERDVLVPQRVRDLVSAHARGRYEGPAGVRLVLAGGVAAGLWERAKRGRTLELRVTLAARVSRRALEQEARRLAGFLGLEPVLLL